MNATLTQININRNNAKRLRAAGFYTEADAYDGTADELQDEINERDRRRIAAKHATVNPGEPRYGWYPIDRSAELEHAKAISPWTCRFCGQVQPAWAGDCLTCETQPMMGDRD